MKFRTLTTAILALTGGLMISAQAQAFDLGIVAFQMSAETHARCANAAEKRAKELGWEVQVLNSNGNLQTHADQIDNLVLKGVDGLVLCMSKPVEADAQFAAAKEAGIPIVTIASGTSPYSLFDVEANEYSVGAQSALYLLGKMNFQGGLLVQRFEANVATRIRGAILDVVLAENKAVKIVGEHSMARTRSWRDDVRNGMQALILQQKGNFTGVWASFDGQAFIIDDLLKEAGYKKGDVFLVSTDGGDEAYRRIADPDSMMTATVAIPFEDMAISAVDDLKAIAVDGQKKEDLVPGPYLFKSAVLVDAANVGEFLK